MKWIEALQTAHRQIGNQDLRAVAERAAELYRTYGPKGVGLPAEDACLAQVPFLFSQLFVFLNSYKKLS